MKAKNILKLSVFFALIVVLAPFSIKAAAPDAITDLRCAFSGTPGSVWLWWSLPAGSPTSYEVKYALSGINDVNYDLAYAYSQSWSGTSVKGFVGGLAQDRTWFFAMKAVNGDGSSGISNIVWCQPDNPTSTVLTTVPSSSIANLQEGMEITAGQDFVIKGQSVDEGGSSIQKAEISLDDGETWQKTVAAKAIDTGFEWEYNWTAPSEGEYSIKARAIDYMGVQEEPADAIGVKVVSQTQTAEETSKGENSQEEDDNQQRRNLLIQIIQILLQLLSGK
ncbi:MAG: Ig-like domain-containing protein [Candidatus Pacebacteria bacterium]|nr:Ig-like domain-containing protein [Candidatus Paceibacterota bacterium]